MDYTFFVSTNYVEVIPASSDKTGSHGCVANSSHPACLGDSRCLERMVQAFLSCVTTGNVKVSPIAIIKKSF